MNPPLKTSAVAVKRLLQRSLVCLISFFLIKTVLIASSIQSTESSVQERKLKLKTFKDIPVAIHKVRNLESETWHKDLEIEVKNISGKRIYFMLVYLIFADEKLSNGEVGISLMYGDPKKNGNIAKYADPEDTHLEPGETYVFTFSEMDRKSLKARHEKFPERTKNFLLRFAIINFGDRTGFEAGESLDLRSRSPALPPPKQEDKKRERSHSTSTATAPQDGCGSGNCYRWYIDPEPVPTSCWCQYTRIATTSPDRPCKRLTNIWIDCDGDGNIDCYHEAIDEQASASCPGATPTPTPTPTPSPSPPQDCDLNIIPNHTNCFCTVNPFSGVPEWSCFCFGKDAANYIQYPQNGGCPSNKINNENDCCVCLDQSSCPDGSARNPYSCQCPPPDNLGDGYEQTQSYCSSFYLVTDHYLCHNGYCNYWYSDFEYLGFQCFLTQ